MSDDSDTVRLGFDAVPEIYDRIRPTYPAALYDRLFAVLPAQPMLVEVGPGTGQATADLLRRGAQVVAVEIGADLAAFLQRKLGAHRGLHIVNASFEEAELPHSAYDAVVSATAYHWVHAPARLEKPADLLKPYGILAVIDTNQVASAIDRGYFDRVQPLYEQYGQAHGKHQQLLTADTIVPAIYQELSASSLYRDVQLFRYPWDQHYTSRDYADLLRSYSGSQAMPERQREDLIHELCTVIDQEYGGTITRPLVITQTMARKM